MASVNLVHNLEIGTQFLDSEYAQCNLEIVQFLDSTERIYQFYVHYRVSSALEQCSNGLRQIMHKPKMSALTHPRPLLHYPRALESGNAPKLVNNYYIIRVGH